MHRSAAIWVWRAQARLRMLDGDRGAARYRRVFPVPPSEVNIGVGTAAQQ